MSTVAPPALGPCRLCGAPAWRRDLLSPVHKCCASPTTACIACEWPAGDGTFYFVPLTPGQIADGLRLHPGCHHDGYPCISCLESRRAVRKKAQRPARRRAA